MRIFLNIISILAILGGFAMLAVFCLATPYGVQYGAACVLFITGTAAGCILAITKKESPKKSK